MTTRVDRWLWSVRICKTRAVAATACRGGHVKINSRPAKPSSSLDVGDLVVALIGRRRYELEVVRLIDKRVGAPAAAECYVDLSPPPPVRESGRSQLQGGRERGSGRPTKRERRQLDRLRGRGP